jgi:hypothetical protein
MTVEEESYGVNQFSIHERNVGVLMVRRARNGVWKVVIEVDVEIKLPDGRTVIARERVPIGARVDPRKPARPVRPKLST